MRKNIGELAETLANYVLMGDREYEDYLQFCVENGHNPLMLEESLNNHAFVAAVKILKREPETIREMWGQEGVELEDKISFLENWAAFAGEFGPKLEKELKEAIASSPEKKEELEKIKNRLANL